MMRPVFGLLLLLLGLCGSGAQGQEEVDPEHTSKSSSTDLWLEVRALRDMVVELKVQLNAMEEKVKESESQVDEMRVELILTKVHMQSLETRLTTTTTQAAAQAMKLESLETRLTASESRTRELEEQAAAQATKLESVETRLTASESRTRELEEQTAAQATKLESVETRLTASESRTRELEEQAADAAQKLESLETRLTATAEEAAAQATKLESLETRLTASESRTRELEEQAAEIKSELLISTSRIDQLEKENADKPKVAFYTGLTNSGVFGPFNTDVTLKFTKVFTNIGQAYNPATGFFTAPVRGVYYFQFTVAGDLAKVHEGVYVYKNNQRIKYSYEWNTDGFLEFFTNSVVLELNVGDVVYLVLPSGFALYDDPGNQSTFSGFLVFPK